MGEENLAAPVLHLGEVSELAAVVHSIPKISLVDFLVSQYSFDITRKTWKHTLLIKSFLDRLDTTE